MSNATTRQAGTRCFRIAAWDATHGKPGSSSEAVSMPTMTTLCARAVSGASSTAFEGGNHAIDTVRSPVMAACVMEGARLMRQPAHVVTGGVPVVDGYDAVFGVISNCSMTGGRDV